MGLAPLDPPYLTPLRTPSPGAGMRACGPCQPQTPRELERGAAGRPSPPRWPPAPGAAATATPTPPAVASLRRPPPGSLPTPPVGRSPAVGRQPTPPGYRRWRAPGTTARHSQPSAKSRVMPCDGPAVVGWVEWSETHRSGGGSVGLAPLDPPYSLWLSLHGILFEPALGFSPLLRHDRRRRCHFRIALRPLGSFSPSPSGGRGWATAAAAFTPTRGCYLGGAGRASVGSSVCFRSAADSDR